jgi:hypothetical protein
LHFSFGFNLADNIDAENITRTLLSCYILKVLNKNFWKNALYVLLAVAHLLCWEEKPVLQVLKKLLAKMIALHSFNHSLEVVVSI